MSTTMERPVSVPAALAPICPAGLAWCLGDPDWHDEDGDAGHDSQFVILPTGTPPCVRHDECHHSQANEVWLNVEREDTAERQGPPSIYLAPHCSTQEYASVEEANLGLDEAEALAAELLRLVALARGSKRARDVRPGDVVVIGGVAQTATVVLLDGDCCPNRETGGHDCAGSVSVETDASGEGEWAATFDLDDLVEVRAEVDR